MVEGMLFSILPQSITSPNVGLYSNCNLASKGVFYYPSGRILQAELTWGVSVQVCHGLSNLNWRDTGRRLDLLSESPGSSLVIG
jgi:hypothetical protein